MLATRSPILLRDGQEPHDSRVVDNSRFKERFANGGVNGILVGDTVDILAAHI